MSTREDARRAVESLAAWQLSEMAGCLTLQADTGAGADFLCRIRDDALEEAEGSTWDTRDAAGAIAERALTPYTRLKWVQFVDLGAWREDLGEGSANSSMDDAADMALYLIGSRLAAALLQKLSGEGE